MRLQRYLEQVLQCNIQPIVILNKKDLVDDPQAYVQQVRALGYQCPVILTSALDQANLEEWAAQYLLPGHTYALLGSSGVGKSIPDERIAGRVSATGRRCKYGQ